MALWLVGVYRSGEFANTVWEFVGVFSDRGKAVGACRDANFFIAPVALDEVAPTASTAFPQHEFPLAGNPA